MTYDEHAFDVIIKQALEGDPIKMAVAHPCSFESLLGAVEATDAGIIDPILVAPRSKLEEIARKHDISLDSHEIIDVEHSHEAAEVAVSLVTSGKAHSLMKGSLHTDEFMRAALDSKKGVRTDRRISHIFVMKVESYPRFLFITDAAINIVPDLVTKQHIVQNAIDLAHILGVELPKVAILAAVENINPNMKTTLDAAALCKMADRKQIKGAILDGPLAFDNAINREAADIKGIDSQVAGDPDILIAPDLESGNMMAKQLHYLAAASSAGIVMGAKCPIVLTSRAEDAAARLASAAVAAVVAQHNLKKFTSISA